MQPNKTKLALALGALLMGASGASNADDFIVAVNTISDVTIAAKTGHDLDFGEAITVTPSTTCTMEGRYPAWADVAIVDSVAPAGGQSVLTGTGCVGSGTTTGTPGIYEVQGEAGLTVNLTISEAVQDDPAYTFKPNSGCYTAYNGDNTADADDCTAYTMGTTIPGVKLPVTDLLETEGNTGIVTPGLIYFTVGGEIGVGPAGLTANQTYTAKFQVDVTY